MLSSHKRKMALAVPGWEALSLQNSVTSATISAAFPNWQIHGLSSCCVSEIRLIDGNPDLPTLCSPFIRAALTPGMLLIVTVPGDFL